jgi:hypothetical protein
MRECSWSSRVWNSGKYDIRNIVVGEYTYQRRWILVPPKARHHWPSYTLFSGDMNVRHTSSQPLKPFQMYYCCVSIYYQLQTYGLRFSSFLWYCFSALLTVHHSISKYWNDRDAFLFNLFRNNNLYMFRALIAYLQEVLHNRHLVYCVRVMSVGCTRRPLFLNNLNKKCITLISLFWDTVLLEIWELHTVTV